MPVYVDDMRAPFGNMLMCHCWADSDEELLAMMRKIGVNTKWIQGHPELSFGKHREASWVHFDISLGKRALAVKHGAVETDRYGPVMHTARLRGDEESMQRYRSLRIEYGRDPDTGQDVV